MFYRVTVESKEQHYPLYEATFKNENQAIKQAEEWSKEHQDKLVFVKFERASDGQEGYINRDGANITGTSWTAE